MRGVLSASAHRLSAHIWVCQLPQALGGMRIPLRLGNESKAASDLHPHQAAEKQQFSYADFFFFFLIDIALHPLIFEGHVYPTLFSAAILLLVTNCESHVLFQ